MHNKGGNMAFTPLSRHNGNILVDNAGHISKTYPIECVRVRLIHPIALAPIVHIDFGFMLSNSPGSVGFESAPFKLSQDYIDILGGIHSAAFADFRRLLIVGFQALRKHADKIILLVEMMQRSKFSRCVSGGGREGGGV